MNLLPAPEPEFDIRNVSYINVVDTYTRSGIHLKSVAKTEDGDIVWERDRIPSRDICFMPYLPPYPWVPYE
jgi:hypothetical protein